MIDTPSPDPVGDLLASAGARPVAPADVAARIRAATEQVWRDEVEARQRRLRRGWIGIGATLALAASIVLAVTFALKPKTPPNAPTSVEAPREVVATLERATGPLELIENAGVNAHGDGNDTTVSNQAGAASVFSPGTRIHAGAAVRTAARTRAALRLDNGVSLRLDIDTTIRFDRAGELRLESGAVYVDTDARADANPSTARRATDGKLLIRTPYGVARDIGTRFEVRLLDRSVRVRVRDGLVQLQQGARAHWVEKGVEIVSDSGGQAARRLVETSGSSWDWVSEAAPSVTIEGETLATFLDWASREGGWTVRFDAPPLAETAKTTIVHGSIDGLTPEEALTAVLTTCGLRYELRDGVVTVSAMRP